MTPSYSKTDARLTGSFFILAAISSITGLKLYDPILTEPDFLVSASAHHNRIILGALNELILVCTATGTGIMLYPYLKTYHESFGMGYVCFRMLEVVFIVIGIVSVLTVLSASESYNQHFINDHSQARGIGLSFIALHRWTFMLGPNFMLAINTFIYSYAFFKTRMIPVGLSRLGLIASCLILTAAILELFGVIQQLSLWGILLALPIAVYEMLLAGWLIAQGFKRYLSKP